MLFIDEYIIRESSKFRLKWDIYIIVMALYNSITIPLNLAFNTSQLDSIGVTIFESFIDLSFFIDIMLNFRTTYTSTKSGEEIYDTQKIAKRYILSG